MKQVRNISLLFLLFALLFSACDNKGELPGFSVTPTGLRYKLHSFGDGAKGAAPLKPSIGDYLVLKLAYRTDKDSVFIDTYTSSMDGRKTVLFTAPSFRGGLEEGIAMLTEGDSATFVISADSLFRKVFKVPMPFFVKEGGIVKVDVKLEKVLTPQQFAQQANEVTEDRDLEEFLQLKEFIHRNYKDLDPLENGLYYLPGATGAGAVAEPGKTVLVSYKASFLNGKQFDATAYPVEFTLGEQGQLIKGLECGICLMREGGKAKFILPSQLAFGAEGSSTGIVPPYTSVVYEVELHKVK